MSPSPSQDSNILARYLLWGNYYEYSEFTNIHDLKNHIKQLIKKAEKDLSESDDEYDSDDEIDLREDTELIEFVNTQHNFGDVLAFSDHRHYGAVVIDKDGNFIPASYDNGNGELYIPYEITQYLTNATHKYSKLYDLVIDLRYDDEFIKKHVDDSLINSKYKYFYDSTNDFIEIEFPEGETKTIHVQERLDPIYNILQQQPVSHIVDVRK